MGDPPRKLVTRWLRALAHPASKVDFLAHYGMNASTDESRAAFKAKVSAAIERF